MNEMGCKGPEKYFDLKKCHCENMGALLVLFNHNLLTSVEKLQ